MRIKWRLWALIIGVALPASVRAADGYDPLAVDAEAKIATVDLTVHDADRDRDVPIRVYLPVSKAPAPVIVFSPGLGGSREHYVYCNEHWAKRGYVAVVLQHPGSDSAVWQDAAPAERFKALSAAADLKNFVLRAKDVPAVLDQLAKWNKETGHALMGRLDMEHIGMSGHSFGAVTTQAVSGEVFGRTGRLTLTDGRIKAAIAMSPSTPRGGDASHAFGSVKIPWMCMTGTQDIAPIGGADMASRLGVYPALPTGDKYELVLDGAEHSAFSDRALPGDKHGRNVNHHKVIIALSTAFWDAYLKHDDAAKTWLSSPVPRSIMEPNDRWQMK
ncbi:MAG: dienelactone hydrolase [Planctomycetes bacterium]|nr:dienelactone hydrolase [Planctomycetota bacterium]